MKNRKIAVITGSRAEYGLLYWLLKEIKQDENLQLQLFVTGMHLSSEFGETYKEIKKDGFKITKKIEILLSSDTEVAINKAIGLGCIGFGEAYEELKPEVVVVLGDRFEILAAALAAHISRIPIAHIHGGEISEGAFDNSIRHCLTKLASLHFPATETYAKRIKQMGEDQEKVFCFGAPGLDNIFKLNLLEKNELEKETGINLNGEEKIGVFTYHPVTLDRRSETEKQIEELLKAIKGIKNLKVIFTGTNADTNGRIINEKIKAFVKSDRKKYYFFTNLGTKKYFSLLKFADVLIGNSSSGIIEAPSFDLPFVNVGDRQKGREKGENVFDCSYSEKEISNTIKKALDISKKFKEAGIENPYEGRKAGETSFLIKEQLKNITLGDQILKKKFFDLF